MAEFTTKCPHCNTELVAEKDWIGMEVECPSCKQTFTVAKAAPKIPKLSIPQIKPITPAANANDENTETSFTFVCPECGTQVELPIVLKGKKYECKACCEESIAEPATEKKCPHCGQMIKFHATICKFCKKNVDVSANASINLQPISPIGNQPVNLQPIQNNNGVNFQQPISPIGNRPVNLQPIQNQPGINLQPINPMQNASYNSAPGTGDLIYYKQQSLLTTILLHLLIGFGYYYIGQIGKTFALWGVIVGLMLLNYAIPGVGILVWVIGILSWVDLIMLFKKLESGMGIKKWEFFAK